MESTMQISSEVYEQVKAQVLAEMEERKLKNRQINLAAEAMFAQAKRKYMDKIMDKFGRGPSGYPRKESVDKFDLATKMALEFYGFKNARSAYLAGYGSECNEMAEKILEVLLQ